MTIKPRHLAGLPRSSGSSFPYDLTGHSETLAGKPDASATDVPDIQRAAAARKPGDCYHYLVLLHACDLSAKQTQSIQLRVEAIAEVFCDYSAVHARDVFDILRAMPDARTCEHPALIKRLRQLADIARIPTMPETDLGSMMNQLSRLSYPAPKDAADRSAEGLVP